VTATEDLMREHGVLRRALLVYSAAAVNLRGNPSSISSDALQKIAKLFRAFGEEYHEKKLEEAYISRTGSRTLLSRSARSAYWKKLTLCSYRQMVVFGDTA
jgi:hemerythrin-like domain-containing protein